MSLTIIAAVAKNNVIGNGNQLIWKIPADMKHFKETTTGHPIIMGKKTFDSIGRLLPNRENIIVTRDRSFSLDGATPAHSIEDMVEKYEHSEIEAFVIGGGKIYKQLLPYASKLIITHIDQEFEGDTFFPEIPLNIFKKTEEQVLEISVENPYLIKFTTYTR
jgi:dihydrofolate reductase